MKSKKMLGIIFANVHDDFLPELTRGRSMASVPFGGRYRMIDFALSAFVNAGISKVGVIPKSNYHSLLDHLGSGKPWDLDRKNDGLCVLPPYVDSDSSLNTGHIQSLHAIRDFLSRCTEEFLVLCDADFIGNPDLSSMLEKHLETGADATFAYATGKMPKNKGDVMAFEMDKSHKISRIRMYEDAVDCNYSVNLVIIKRTLLIKLVQEAVVDSLNSLWRDIFQANVECYNFYGFEIKNKVWVIDSPETYVSTNFDLLNAEVRKDLFCKDRPIYTKTRDDLPTRYGLQSKVNNSLIADGCFIEGTVNNSILFRGVHVGAGAVINNSIIMQDSDIAENATLKNVVLDKEVTVSAGTNLCGADTQKIFIRKEAKI